MPGFFFFILLQTGPGIAMVFGAGAQVRRHDDRLLAFPPWLALHLATYLPCRRAFAAVFYGASLVRSCALLAMVVRSDMPHAHALHLRELRITVPTATLALGRLPHLRRGARNLRQKRSVRVGWPCVTRAHNVIVVCGTMYNWNDGPSTLCSRTGPSSWMRAT